MKIVWKRKTCAAQEVIDNLSHHSWSPATIKTLLNRLLQKGAVHFTKTGKSYLYTAAWNEEDCKTNEVSSFLNRVFDGGLSPMLVHFVRSRRLSKKELQELERILKAAP